MYDIRFLGSLSYKNRDRLTAQRCSCYYCKKSFDTVLITEWADDEDLTALCPICNIDAVLPGEVDSEFLSKANEYYFT